MFCSTIIPTVGRHSLARAVNSVLSQAFDRDDFEVIVVNDSGAPIGMEAWQSSQRITLIHTNRRERSVARNTGASIARGKFLHFLDDDDWLFPNALETFWHLSAQTQASWLYGGSQLVKRDGSELIQLHHGIHGNCFLPTMAGEWIPLQSSLIDTKIFHTLGGFSPLITGPEDIDLLRRICLSGDLAETTNLIANIERGNMGSTTDYTQHPELSRQARENILDSTGAFSRMRAGAISTFWFGKLLRIYFTSTIWNIQRSRIMVAGNRLAYGLAVIISSGYRILSKGFWISFVKPYQSPTFERGIKLPGRNFGS